MTDIDAIEAAAHRVRDVVGCEERRGEKLLFTFFFIWPYLELRSSD